MSAGQWVEEETMEKKASRPSSVPPKAGVGDIKKDNDNGNKSSRYSRRKDHASLRPREQARKPSTPKRVDKRPRTRGHFNDNPVQDVAKDPVAEYGSAMVKGSKKGNLNHLLNFTFASSDATYRGGGSGHGGGHGGRGGQGYHRWGGRRHVKYNKEQFLQANCQFIVRDGADYTLHTADPDTLVSWDLIEQVQVFSHGVPSCPICLYPPTAAKMTRCGHIYCWSCMLHYLSLSERTWHKCPICYESIHEKDLKSVTAIDAHNYLVGEEITMKLMKRTRGSTITLPSMQWSAELSEKPSNVGDGIDTCYSKLLLATPSQVQEIIDSESRDLQRQLKEEGEQSLEGSFILAAIEQLKVRQAAVRQLAVTRREVREDLDRLTVSEGAREEQETAGTDLPVAHFTANKDAVEYACAFLDKEETTVEVDAEGKEAEEEHCENGESGEDEEDEADEQIDAVEVVELPSAEAAAVTSSGDLSVNNHREKSSTDAHYFYQAADGQHVFLHSVNARCLAREYGSLENSPHTITATIVAMESFSMTEELRRRLRYLNHLPLTCEYQVAELALKPPLVSTETIHEFTEEIDRRRRQRQRKTKEEQRRSRRINMEENMKMGRYPRMHIKLSSMHEFPGRDSGGATVDDVRSESATTSTAASDVSSPASTPIGSPPGTTEDTLSTSPWGPGSCESAGSGVSFAQMLRAGKARPQEPVAVAGVGGATRGDSDASDSEDRVPVPVFQNSFGDAIQKALDSYATHPDSDAAATAGKSPSGGKKKKRVPKKLLFATTMARSK